MCQNQELSLLVCQMPPEGAITAENYRCTWQNSGSVGSVIEPRPDSANSNRAQVLTLSPGMICDITSSLSPYPGITMISEAQPVYPDLSWDISGVSLGALNAYTFLWCIKTCLGLVWVQWLNLGGLWWVSLLRGLNTSCKSQIAPRSIWTLEVSSHSGGIVDAHPTTRFTCFYCVRL